MCQQPKVGAQCGNSARWDLRGGRLVKGRPYRNSRLSIMPRRAEAVLKLRALLNSGDFDSYWTFHERQEKARNHDSRYTVDHEAAKQDTAGSHLRLVRV